jgi:hypothetical protein
MVAIILSVALTVSVWARSGAPGLLDQWSTFTVIIGQSEGPPDIDALADAAYLSDQGREIFHDTRPQIVDPERATELCDRALPVDAAGQGPSHQVSFELGGCYIGDGTGEGTIVLVEPDTLMRYHRLVTVAAHEMLHAAWDRMGLLEKEELVPLLEAEVAALDADDPIHEQISWSVDGHEGSRPTELFAYVGTQVWRDGGLDPRLEEVYARFISDRAALVAVHTDRSFG